jgi:hypothetical protein
VILARLEPHRTLYLAVPQAIDRQLLSTPFGEAIVTDVALRILVFDPHEQKVVRWIE